MPNPISNEVWIVIGQWLVYGASLTGAVMAIARFIKWIRSKTTVAKLEERINKHTEYLNNDDKRIKSLEQLYSSNKTGGLTMTNTASETDLEDIHALMRLSIKASQALLKNNLDGNNREAVEEANAEIQNYLNGKI